MRRAIKDISEASRNLKELSHSADGLVQNDARAFIADAQQTSASYRQLADTLDKLVKTNGPAIDRSEEHTSELQSLMRISYAVFCLKKKRKETQTIIR